MPKIDWISSLKNVVMNDKRNRAPKDIEQETDKLFLSYMQGYVDKKQSHDETYQTIPRFFNKKLLEKNTPSLHNLIQREARSRFLHHKTTEILDKEDLETLWEEIKNNVSPPEDGTERLNYDSFLRVARSLPPKCRHFFSASTFLKFDRDEYGRIDAVSFFHSIVRKVSLFQTRIQISLYDKYGNGYLLPNDLESFINELLPTFPNLEGISDKVREAYLIIATAKFRFFLDPRRTGRIFIKDILTSPILAELYDLRSEKSPEEFLSNWFSKQNASKLVELFDQLDEDKNGFLSIDELSKFQWGLTRFFLSRVLDRYTKEENNYEMDFKTFVEFVLIIENRKTRQSILFFFECIDVFGKGYIDAFTINMFFKEVMQKLLTKDSEADKNFHIEDVKDEIFDMANPSDSKVISLYDLYKCGQGDTVLSIIVDAKAFFDYDQRELGNTLNVDEDSHFQIIPGLNDDEEMEEEDNNANNDILGMSKPAVKTYGKFAEV